MVFELSKFFWLFISKIYILGIVALIHVCEEGVLSYESSHARRINGPALGRYAEYQGGSLSPGAPREIPVACQGALVLSRLRRHLWRRCGYRLLL